ncbi:PAS domain S-box protein [Solidesulfovibrio sp.]
MPKRVLYLLGLTLTTWLVWAALAAAQPQRILHAASELDYPPFALVTPDNAADGFSVELLQAVVQAVDMGVDFRIGPWQSIKQELIDGKIDVLPLVSHSKEREQYFDFTIPYLKMHGTIFVRKGDNRIRVEGDLKDKEVLVMRGDTAHEYALRRHLSDHLILTEDFETAFRLLASGRHDAVIVQQIVGWQLITKLGLNNLADVCDMYDQSLKPFDKPLADFEQKFCIAVRRGDHDLLAKLNEGLATVIANGTYDTLYGKWFGPILPAKPVDTKTLLQAVVFIIVPSLLLMALAGLWYLRREVARKTLTLRQEIEERKAVALALQESEARIRHITDSAQDAILMIDPGGRVTFWNPAARRMFGYTAEEAIGQDMHALIAPDRHQAAYRAAFAGFRTTGQGETLGKVIDTSARRKDGTEFPVSLSLSALQLQDGRHAIGIIRDSTEQKKAEQSLKHSEERYRSLFTAQLDAFALHEIILDPDGRPTDYRFLAVNPAFEAITGQPAEATIGRTVSEVFPDTESYWIEAYGNVALRGECLRLENYSSGLGRYFEVSAYSPAPGQFAVVFRDVTERHKANRELTLAKEAAEAASLAKNEFLANMSHEIRTPLNGVLGMLQLLAMTTTTVEQDEYIVNAIKSSKRLARLLADILDLSRIEAGKLTLGAVPFALADLKDATETLLSPTAREKKIHLDCVLAGNLPAVVIGDQTRVGQILFNIVGNAIKFTEKGLVRLDISPLLRNNDTQHILFVVSDTGIGISTEQQRNIFEPFVQGDGSYTRRFQGAGLGLSIVRRLVALLGGELAIDSDAGAGTTVYVSLPFRLPAVGQHPGQPEKPSLPPSRDTRLRILVAEDDATSLLAARRLLEKWGHTVTGVADGEQALACLAAQSFDLVVMDVQMPVMDGVAATKRIRASDSPQAAIPIIAMTAYAMSGDREAFLAAGMDAYIAKPVTEQVLRGTIERLLSAKARSGQEQP